MCLVKILSMCGSYDVFYGTVLTWRVFPLTMSFILPLQNFSCKQINYQRKWSRKHRGVQTNTRVTKAFSHSSFSMPAATLKTWLFPF